MNMRVPIFEPAKTVADCFKFRNKIGTDVAIEALRDCLGNRRATVEELLLFARICRVENVMRPYLEAIAGSKTSSTSGESLRSGRWMAPHFPAH
jgi:hypothetical protein